MSLTTIQVSLLNAATGKAQLVTLPRDMAVADMRKLAGDSKAVAFTVDGCTPAASATLGDLYDACAKDGTLVVAFTKQASFGAMCGSCSPCGSSDSVLGGGNSNLDDLLGALGNGNNDLGGLGGLGGLTN